MGGCRCSYKNCKNTTKTTENIHFFHYPVKHKERCIKWIENAAKPKFFELEEDQLRNKVICEVHFEEKWFPNSQKKRLLQGAVPTLDGDCEDETPQTVSDTSMYLPYQMNDVQVLPANEDRTIFLLDTDNIFSRSHKVKSYIYKNGVLVPSNSSQTKLPVKTLNKTVATPKPSTSIYCNSSDMEFDSVVNSCSVSQVTSLEELKEEDVEYKPVIEKESIKMQDDSSTNGQNYSSDNLQRKSTTNRPAVGKGSVYKYGTEKTVNRNYLRKIKQHSRDIATIKRMLMQKNEETKPDTKTALSVLQEQIPSSMYTILSLLLGEKNDLNDDDIEFFTTFHRASPEAYQLLSEKYSWNLPSVDVVEGPE